MPQANLAGIRSKIMTLEPNQRAELAADLLASLDGEADAGSAAAWDAELIARMDAWRTGSAKSMDVKTFTAMLDGAGEIDAQH